MLSRCSLFYFIFFRFAHNDASDSSLFYPFILNSASSTMKSVIGDSKYAHGKVQEWIDKIGALSVEELQGLSPNFKYVVTTLIIQKLGSGLRMETVI